MLLKTHKTVPEVGASSDTSRNTLFFCIEGMLFSVVSMLGTNTNNLFLSRLGASDFQLSFFIMLAQVLTMVALVPSAIYTDRLKNKRKMIWMLLGFIGVSYLIAATAPLFGDAVLYVVIIFAAFGVSGVALCQSTWQAFFADVVPEDQRNRTFAMRNQAMFIMNVCIPLAAGLILNAVETDQNKVIVHQIYYVCIGLAAASSAYFLSKIRGGDVANPMGKSFKDFKDAVVALAHNRRFLFFAGVAFLFYASWNLDGTIFYLGQTKYIGLTDFWYIFSNVCCGVALFISIRFWAKRNEKMGVRFGIIFGAIGITLSPLCIILPLMFDNPTRMVLHFVLRFMTDLTFATVTLNILQNLLQVIDEKNRALSIAAYTILISLSNAIFPTVGVAIYTGLGADQNAMIFTCLIMMAARMVALSGFIFRWWILRKEPK